MHYYIDGYNLLFRLLRADDDLQTKREEIIKELEIKINRLEIDATLVFDAQYQQADRSRSHVNRLEICFTSIGETADDYILQSLKEDPKSCSQQTVVTSDKKLAWLARRSHAKTESVEEFILWLNRRYKNKISKIKKGPKSISSISFQKNATPKTKTPPTTNAVPGSLSSPEECFDFYLSLFENEYLAILKQQEENKEKKKSLSKPQRKKQTKPAINADSKFISNEKRWQHAFERYLQQDEEK